MQIIFKVFIEFVTPLLLFFALFFWPRGSGILASGPGIEPPPPALEGKVFTVGPPAKSQPIFFLYNCIAMLICICIWSFLLP